MDTGLSDNVLEAFKQSDWDVSEGVSQLSDNLYVAEFAPNIRSYLREALKENDIDVFSGLEFDGTDEGLLSALSDKQEELNALTENPDIDVDNSIIGFSENLQYLIDAVEEAVNSEDINKAEDIDSETVEDDDLIINNESEGIEIRGYEGTWHSVDSVERDGKEYFLMENEQKGDALYNLVLDSEGYLIVEGVDGAFDKNALNAIDAYNGLSIDLLEEEQSTEESEHLIDKDADDVVIDGYDGEWHVEDSVERDGVEYFLMKSNDSVDDEFYNLVLNEDGYLIVEDVDGGLDNDVLNAIDEYDGQPVSMTDRPESNVVMINAVEFSADDSGQFSLFGVMDTQQIAADDMPSGISSDISESFDALRADIANMIKPDEHVRPVESHGGPEL